MDLDRHRLPVQVDVRRVLAEEGEGQIDVGLVQEPALTLLQQAGARVLVNGMSMEDAKTYLGGSFEFMRLATNFGGEVYFSFRHYLAMARELDTPKILVCPTDTRLPAEDR